MWFSPLRKILWKRHLGRSQGPSGGSHEQLVVGPLQQTYWEVLRLNCKETFLHCLVQLECFTFGLFLFCKCQAFLHIILPKYFWRQRQAMVGALIIIVHCVSHEKLLKHKVPVSWRNRLYSVISGLLEQVLTQWTVFNFFAHIDNLFLFKKL